MVGGVIYIEPENSDYAKSDIFECLENALLSYIDDKCILLLGDFNSRTGSINDFINCDHYNFDVNDDDLKVAERIDNEDLLLEYGIPKCRSSTDRKCNNYGHKLINMCKNLGLMIANGRCGKDAFIGKFSCKDASVVDYLIASPRILTCLYDFDVITFNEFLSDIHCPLHVALKANNMSTNCVRVVTPSENPLKRPKWKEEFKSTFHKYINLNDIENTLSVIFTLNQKDNIDQNDIDCTYGLITNILYQSARDCGSIIDGNITHRRAPRKHYNDWWNSECEHKRKLFKLAWKNNIYDKSEQANQRRKQASKEYKKTIKQAINMHHIKLNSKIRSLQSNNPRDFWKLINSSSNKTPKVSPICCNEFAEHFQKLNADVDNDDFDIYDIPATDNSPLNNPITIEEVQACIHKLKNNKACGYDAILNEFIKCSENEMSNIYVLFFNMVLKTGIVPDDWVTGIIMPIFKNKGSRQNVDNYRGITLLSCFGKLFTYILNERLKLFLDYNNILCEEQSGFRGEYSPSDNLFSLNFIINLYINRGMKLYGAFIDYRKAFDSVHRVTLWRKLVGYNIDGSILKVIFNMYSQAKSCEKSCVLVSSFFACKTGV